MEITVASNKADTPNVAFIFKANLGVESADLEEVDSYVYPGQEINMHHNLLPEIAHRKIGTNSIAPSI